LGRDLAGDGQVLASTSVDLARPKSATSRFTLGIKQDVSRLEIAMEDALPMGMGHGVGATFATNSGAKRDGNGPSRTVSARLFPGIIQDQVRQTSLRPLPAKAHVWMTQPRRILGFRRNRSRISAFANRGQQSLDRHDLARLTMTGR